MTKKLTDKVAIVTGGSKGIGASIAQKLSEEGAHVVVNYSKSKKEAEDVVQQINQNGGKAIAVEANLTNRKDINHLFFETKKAFGKLDILINNAGIYEFAALENVSEEHFHKHFNLNVLSLLLACQMAVNYFPSTGGSIVNISSLASKSWCPNALVYSASKAAVDSLTRSLGCELGPKKIRVNAINPGIIETEGTNSTGVLASDLRKKVEMKTPLGRIGFPQDVAKAVVFLASNDAEWITGETLVITGGFR